MKFFVYLPLLAFFFSAFTLNAQTLTSREVLIKSMDYHDPDRQALTRDITLTLNEPRPGGADRISVITFSPKKDQFILHKKTDEDEVKMTLTNEVAKFSLNGSTKFTEEERKKHRLTEDRLKMMRNYYHYLWMLPMKLEDPGTIMDHEVQRKDFFGKDAWQIRVSYEPYVGKDIWYFYFHPETFAMIGYRFYHDESKNDGEYILIEGEVEHQNLRIPQTRKWYKHQKDEYLGMDVLQKIEF